MPTKEQIAQYLKAKKEQEEAGYGQNTRRGSSQDVLDAIERGIRKEDKFDQSIRRTRGYEGGGVVSQNLVNTDDYMNEFKQPMVTQEDVVNAELEKLNEEVKRPSIKTKPELVVEEVKQELEKTPIGQALQDRSPSSTPEVDPMLVRYKQAIEDYQAKLNEKPEENQVMNWLTGIGKGANVISKMKGTSPGEVEYYGDTQKARGQASKKQNLDGLQNLQSMYAKYMEMQKKKEPKEMSKLDKAKAETEEAKAGYYKARSKSPSQKVTEGEKVIDREFAKDYNKWSSGGKADYEVNSKIFKDAIKNLRDGKVSTGFASGAASTLGNIVGYKTDTKEEESTIRKAINGMLRATLGSQFTQEEGERIFKQTFDPAATEETNIRNMEAELSKLEKRKEAIENMGEYYTKNKTLSGYEVPVANSKTKEEKYPAPQGEIVERNGKRYKWNPSVQKYQLY